MIPNHAQFLEAIQAHKLLRIAFYSAPDGGVVDRECAPLNYSPAADGADPANRYWVWDPTHTAGVNPLGLLPGQIVSVQVLGEDFDPAAFPTATALPPPAAAPAPTPTSTAVPPATEQPRT